MTFTEMSDVLAIIGAIYPRFYANLSENDVKAMTNVWLSFFASDDASLVSDAVTQAVGGQQEADEHDERQADCERIEGDVPGLCEISDHVEA